MQLNQVDQAVTQASARYQTIRGLEAAFREALSTSAKLYPTPGAELRVSDGLIVGSMLGISIEAASRPVAMDGKLMAVEWIFTGVGHGVRDQVFVCYQWEDGRLTRSPDGSSDGLCGTNNSYLAKHLIGEILPTLLASPFFGPS